MTFIRPFIWVGFCLAAVAFLVFLWSSLLDFIFKRIWERYPKLSDEKQKTIQNLLITGTVLSMVFIMLIGTGMILIAYLEGKFWFYFYAAGILIIFPACITIFLHEWWERRVRKKEMEKAIEENEKINERLKQHHKTKGDIEI